jgi:hypothetical protein
MWWLGVRALGGESMGEKELESFPFCACAMLRLTILPSLQAIIGSCVVDGEFNIACGARFCCV